MRDRMRRLYRSHCEKARALDARINSINAYQQFDLYKSLRAQWEHEFYVMLSHYANRTGHWQTILEQLALSPIPAIQPR